MEQFGWYQESVFKLGRCLRTGPIQSRREVGLSRETNLLVKRCRRRHAIEHFEKRTAGLGLHVVQSVHRDTEANLRLIPETKAKIEEARRFCLQR